MSKQKTTRTDAFNIATKHMFREGVTKWSWARTKRLDDESAWMVTIGNFDHALWRITIDDDGTVTATEPVFA